MADITIDKIANDTLRGQQFISDKDELNCRRICENCFYGVIEMPVYGGIGYAGKCLTSRPLELFKEKSLPNILDGKKVGNFCHIYANYLHFEEI